MAQGTTAQQGAQSLQFGRKGGDYAGLQLGRQTVRKIDGA